MANDNKSKAPWTNTSWACKETWGLLFFDEELNVNFFQAGDVKMSELAFYNPAVSSGTLDIDAEYRAARLDRLFQTQGGGKYKSGWNTPKSVSAMKTVLENKDKLVRDLAAQANDIYAFSGN
jgi:hypothetical protein